MDVTACMSRLADVTACTSRLVDVTVFTSRLVDITAKLNNALIPLIFRSRLALLSA